jgi:hypothetical protein
MIIESTWTRQLGPVNVRYERRSRESRMGRFGGGWQWEVGVRAGNLTRQRGTLYITLLVASLRVSWDRRTDR